MCCPNPARIRFRCHWSCPSPTRRGFVAVAALLEVVATFRRPQTGRSPCGAFLLVSLLTDSVGSWLRSCWQERAERRGDRRIQCATWRFEERGATWTSWGTGDQDDAFPCRAADVPRVVRYIFSRLHAEDEFFVASLVRQAGSWSGCRWRRGRPST